MGCSVVGTRVSCVSVRFFKGCGMWYVGCCGRMFSFRLCLCRSCMFVCVFFLLCDIFMWPYGSIMIVFFLFFLFMCSVRR